MTGDFGITLCHVIETFFVSTTKTRPVLGLSQVHAKVKRTATETTCVLHPTSALSDRGHHQRGTVDKQDAPRRVAADTNGIMD